MCKEESHKADLVGFAMNIAEQNHCQPHFEFEIGKNMTNPLTLPRDKQVAAIWY